MKLFRRKLKDQNDKLNDEGRAEVALEPVNEDSPAANDKEAHLGHIKRHVENKAILHACVWLDPKTFKDVVGPRSKVDFEKWYDLLWYIQHEPKTPTVVFAQRLGLSWKTTDIMRTKLKQVIYDARIITE